MLIIIEPQFIHDTQLLDVKAPRQIFSGDDRMIITGHSGSGRQITITLESADLKAIKWMFISRQRLKSLGQNDNKTESA